MILNLKFSVRLSKEMGKYKYKLLWHSFSGIVF